MKSLHSSLLIIVCGWLGLAGLPSAAWSQDVPPPLPTPVAAAPQYAQPAQYAVPAEQYQAPAGPQPPPQPTPYVAPAPGQPVAGPPQPVYGPPPPGAVMVAPAQPVYAYPASPYPYAQPPVIVVTPAPPMAEYHLSATIDALFLDRSAGSSIPLGFTAYNPSSHLPPALPTDRLYSDDAVFPLAAGLRVELNEKLTDRWSLSGVYWGLQQWSVGSTIYGDPDTETILAYSPYLQMTNLIGGFDDSITYKYDSKVENVEFNAVYRINAYDPYFELDWLVGARYMYLSDHFTLTGVDDYNGVTETLDYGTSNNLIGAQTGLLLIRGWSRFQWELGAKFAVMSNSFQQHGSDAANGPSGTPGGFNPYSVSNNGSTVSGLFELTFALRYRLSESLWLRLGYQAYDVTNVALAPRQLDSFGHGGNVFYDGLSIGLQATW